MTSGADQPVA